MKRLGFLAALGTMICASAPLSAQEATMDYTVVEGDSCEKIAAKFWGDPKRYDKLHELNPQMGPVPHKLKPGTVLKVVRPGPLAKVTFVRHDVESATPGAHKAQLQEPLAQGNKVTTQADSSAEVTFKDDSRIQLAEHTLVVILGGTMHLADKQATAADTQLMTGELRAHLGALAGKKPIATPGATVALGEGEAKVDVDPKKTTRLAVYKGQSSLAASGKKVDVPQGFGSKADMGKAPTKPKPLPEATKWVTAIPRVSLTFAETIDVSGAYAAGGGPVADTFHVQLSRDAAFNDLVLDAKVPATITKLEAKQLPPGTYYARVSGIDNDKFEGTYGEVSMFVVSRVVALTVAGKAPQIDVAKGLFCGFDGGPLAVVQGPLDVPAGKQHTLECAAAADGAGAAEIKVDGAQPEVKVATKFEPAKFSANGGERDVVLTLTDASGKPATGASVTASAPAGVTVEPAHETTPGTYVAHVRWTGATAGKITFTINGAQTSETELPNETPPAAAPVAAAPAAEPEEVFRPLEIGFGLGAQSGRDRVGVGASFALDGTYNLRLGSTAILGFGGRAQYEHYGVRTGADAGETSHTGDAFTLGVPVTLRFAGLGSAFMPYLALTPQVLFDRVKTNSFASTSAATQPRPPLAETSYESNTDFGLAAGGGLRFLIGSRAWLSLEMGYRFSKQRDVREGAAGFVGLYETLGIRVGF